MQRGLFISAMPNSYTQTANFTNLLLVLCNYNHPIQAHMSYPRERKDFSVSQQENISEASRLMYFLQLRCSLQVTLCLESAHEDVVLKPIFLFVTLSYIFLSNMMDFYSFSPNGFVSISLFTPLLLLHLLGSRWVIHSVLIHIHVSLPNQFLFSYLMCFIVPFATLYFSMLDSLLHFIPGNLFILFLFLDTFYSCYSMHCVIAYSPFYFSHLVYFIYLLDQLYSYYFIHSFLVT